jgi:5-methylcytosine-specific restriction endonuclease McrA
VGLRDITRTAILAAIAEYDRLGQDEFLVEYGFDRARSYLLIHDGKAYDSKAIAGVAHGFLPGERALTTRDFSGGQATVGRLLRGLGPAEAALSARAAEYRRLCDRVDVFWSGRDSTRANRTSADPVRSADARQAVLVRSEGRCENPGCTGDIGDLTDSGDPILEIDHIHDLAKGGPDNPVQMIALCPNCHEIKTRGRTREQLRGVLFAVAKRRHDALMARTPTLRAVH